MARELLQDPPSPEEEAAHIGAQGIAQAAIEDLLARVRRGEQVPDSDIDAILAKGASRAVALQLIRGLTAPDGGASAVQPTSASDLANMATAASTVATNAASLAIDRETATRQELQTTLQTRDQVVQTAVDAERTQGLAYVGLLREVMSGQANQAVTAVQAQSSAALARMEELARRAEEARDAELLAVRQKADADVALEKERGKNALELERVRSQAREAQARAEAGAPMSPEQALQHGAVRIELKKRNALAREEVGIAHERRGWLRDVRHLTRQHGPQVFALAERAATAVGLPAAAGSLLPDEPPPPMDDVRDDGPGEDDGLGA